MSACLSLPGTVLVHNFFMKNTWYVNDGCWPVKTKSSSSSLNDQNMFSKLWNQHFLLFVHLNIIYFYVCLIGLNTILNNFSVISWMSVLLVEKASISKDNNWSWVGNWQHYWNISSIIIMLIYTTKYSDILYNFTYFLLELNT